MLCVVYEAVGHGCTYSDAFEEGKAAVKKWETLHRTSKSSKYNSSLTSKYNSSLTSKYNSSP